MTDANADAARGEEGGRDWESALLLLVPAAEPAVAKHRATLDASARYGVPAHLTVLYPFLPPGLIDDAVLASLGDLFAGVAGFRLTLDRVGWFGDDVVWLGPRDEAPVRALTGLAFAAFPSCAPYGGQHADVVPHLTVGHLGGASALRAAGEAVRHRLPIEAAATKVTLMTGPPTGKPGTSNGRWRTMAEFGFGRPGRLPEPSGLSLAGPFGMTAGRCGPMLVLFPPRWHYLHIGRW